MQSYEYPSILRRYLSSLIDGLLILTVLIIIPYLFEGDSVTLFWIRLIIAAFMALIYEPFCTSKFCTLGQRITGIRIRRYLKMQSEPIKISEDPYHLDDSPEQLDLNHSASRHVDELMSSRSWPKGSSTSLAAGRVDYQKISIPAAYIRIILKVVLGFISFISIIFSKDKRAIHDFAAGSIVISSEPQTEHI